MEAALVYIDDKSKAGVWCLDEFLFWAAGENMKDAKRLQSLMLGASLLMTGMPSWAVVDSPGGPAVRQMNLQPPVTQIAQQIYSLHNLMLVICLVIFVAVFGVMFYSILKHRKSLGHKSATFHESTAVEIAWTVVPFLIVIGMALRSEEHTSDSSHLKLSRMPSSA